MMTAEEYQRQREREDEIFGFVLSYYNGRYGRTYQKRFTRRREMNEFIERNRISSFDVQRFYK